MQLGCLTALTHLALVHSRRALQEGAGRTVEQLCSLYNRMVRAVLVSALCCFRCSASCHLLPLCLLLLAAAASCRCAAHISTFPAASTTSCHCCCWRWLPALLLVLMQLLTSAP